MQPGSETAPVAPAGASSLLPRVLALCLVFIAIFTGLWVGAFHTSTPHDVPIGVVGSASPPASSAVSITHYSDDGALQRAVSHGMVAGGLDISGGVASIWVGGAQGKQTLMFTTAYLTGIAAQEGAKPTVKTLARFASGDPSGVVPFFVALSLLVPSLIAGAVIGISTTLRRPTRLALLLGYSVLAYLIDWLIADRWLGAITGNSADFAGVVGLYALAVAATAAGLTAWGRPLVAVAGALFLGLGVPATGGPATLGYFIPRFYQRLQLTLPPSAAVHGIRAAEWFGGVGVSTACLALGAWSVAGVAVMLARPHIARPSTKG